MNPYPFPLLLHPQSDQLRRYGTTWMQSVGLVHTHQEAARFEAEAYWYLIAGSFPDAPWELLTVIHDWNAWGFTLDDQDDQGGLSRDPGQLEAFFAPVQALLADQAVPLTSPFLAALADIWERLHACTTPSWRARFAATLAEGLHAYRWETANRLRGQVPVRAEYIEQRRQTGGWLTEVVMTDLIVGHEASPAVLTHPTVAALLAAANDLICWSNDLFSWNKERRTGEIHNLVCIVANEEGCSEVRAYQIVQVLHDRRLQEFLAVERQLPSFALEADRQTVASYAALCRHFVAANWAWSARTSRYHVGDYRPDVAREEAPSGTEMQIPMPSPTDPTGIL